MFKKKSQTNKWFSSNFVNPGSQNEKNAIDFYRKPFSSMPTKANKRERTKKKSVFIQSLYKCAGGMINSWFAFAYQSFRFSLIGPIKSDFNKQLIGTRSRQFKPTEENDRNKEKKMNVGDKNADKWRRCNSGSSPINGSFLVKFAEIYSHTVVLHLNAILVHCADQKTRRKINFFA